MAELSPLPPRARFSLRGDDATLRAGCAAFGVGAPPTLRASVAGERAALWLGPDDCLLLAPPGTRAPAIEASSALVDISERQLGFALAGRGGATMLAAGCPLDLDRFAIGACTRTVLGKAEIVLWRQAPFLWHLEIWRSFADYARALLAQAARDW